MKKIEKIIEAYRKAKIEFDTQVKNKIGSCIATLSYDGENKFYIQMQKLNIEEATLLRDWLNDMLKETK